MDLREEVTFLRSLRVQSGLLAVATAYRLHRGGDDCDHPTYPSPVPMHRPTRAYDTPGHGGPVPCLDEPLQHPSRTPAATDTLAVATVSADAGRQSPHARQFAGRINPAAWPEMYASRHQGLLILRIGARL